MILTKNGNLMKFASGAAVNAIIPPEPDEVTIGTQTWKSKDLAIDDGQGGIYTQTLNFGQGEVTEYYYTWDAAVRVAATVQGWHLPTTTEWDTLAAAVGGSSIAGTKLKSTYGWTSGNGDGTYGFDAFPVGYFNSTLQGFGTITYIWTADSRFYLVSWYRGFYTGASMISNSVATSNYLPVRLIKDS